MGLRDVANRTIPKPQLQQQVLYNDGDTGDIMKEVLQCFEESKMQLENFAPHLKGRSLRITCNNIWRFVKENISYKVDPPGVQWIKEPVRTWHDKVCDCKSYSIFIASLLHNLGIKGTFRFVSFKAGDSTPTHVYVVVKDGDSLIKIDGVMPGFDIEKPFNHKHDYNMSQISRMSGIGNTEPVIMYATDLEVKRILLEAERDMYNSVAGISGPSVAIYNKYIDDINAAIEHAQQTNVNGVGSIFSKIWTGVKNITKKITKVALAPITLPMRLALEKQIPAGSDAFLYLHIQNPDVVAKLPDAIKNKRNKQDKFCNFLVDLMPFLKYDHIVSLARAGHIKKNNETPEATLSKKFGFAVSGDGIGWVAVIGAIIGLIGKILSLFKKKPPVEAAEVTPEESDWASLTPEQQADLSAGIANQPTNTTLLDKITEVVNTGADTIQQIQATTGKTVSPGTNLMQVDNQGQIVPVRSQQYAQPYQQPQQAGMSTNTMLLVGALAVGAIFMMKKK
ncbi:MAG: transglutaminase-like domain-containing protein [Chitinophagaceae bacterium]